MTTSAKGGRHDYRRLDPALVAQTLEILERRVAERFPDAGLTAVARQLHRLSQDAVKRAARIQRPNILLRIVIFLLIAAIIGILVTAALSVRVTREIWELDSFAQSLEAVLGSLVFIGAAILFLTSLETRLKRARALTAIHELRAFAHIVDMHQLTKDPERVASNGPATPSSPKRTMTPFLLGRYLDYCSEMLSLICKVGAVYVQDFPDETSLVAVNDLDALANGMVRNIWQKIMILERLDPSTEQNTASG